MSDRNLPEQQDRGEEHSQQHGSPGDSLTAAHQKHTAQSGAVFTRGYNLVDLNPAGSCCCSLTTEHSPDEINVVLPSMHREP